MAVRVGISGWTYPPWRGVFYPKGLPHRSELGYAAARLGSIEINGSFYALQRPTSYRQWREETPDDFVFSVKAGRFITHMKKLRDVEEPVATFLASGPLALAQKLGPILWQLPPNLGWERERITAFLRALPRSTDEAAYLARRHSPRLSGRAWTGTDADRPLRHALEVRHDSFRTREFVELMRAESVAVVVADTAGKWPTFFDLTADFMYARLHGESELYTSGYDDDSLRMWVDRIAGWQAAADTLSSAGGAAGIGAGSAVGVGVGFGAGSGSTAGAGVGSRSGSGALDCYLYFDNDVKVRAPYDAMRMQSLLGERGLDLVVPSGQI